MCIHSIQLHSRVAINGKCVYGDKVNGVFGSRHVLLMAFGKWHIHIIDIATNMLLKIASLYIYYPWLYRHSEALRDGADIRHSVWFLRARNVFETTSSSRHFLPPAPPRLYANWVQLYGILARDMIWKTCAFRYGHAGQWIFKARNRFAACRQPMDVYIWSVSNARHSTIRCYESQAKCLCAVGVLHILCVQLFNRNRTSSAHFQLAQ